MPFRQSERQDCLGPLDTMATKQQKGSSQPGRQSDSPLPSALKPLQAISIQPVSVGGIRGRAVGVCSFSDRNIGRWS